MSPSYGRFRGDHLVWRLRVNPNWPTSTPKSARCCPPTRDDSRELLGIWPKIQRDYASDEFSYTVRGKEIRVPADLPPRWPAPRCPRCSCRCARPGPASCATSFWKTCPAPSPTPRACFRSNAPPSCRPACSPARAAPNAPTNAFTSWPTAKSPPPACPPPSTR